VIAVPHDHEARRARIRAELGSLSANSNDAREIAGLLVSSRQNVQYLSGFAGSFGMLLLGTDEADDVLFTDGRYDARAATEAPGLSRHIGGGLPQQLTARVGDRFDGRALAVETHVLTVDEYGAFAAGLTHVELLPAGRLVERARLVKDESELAALRIACSISTTALVALLAAGGLVGRSELQIARDLENRMFGLGADQLAFPTIVAAGPNAAIPHHQPTDRPLAVGDLLKIDFGAAVGGYHADCTRSFIAGTPADWQREIHAAVQQAQIAGVAACTDGTAIADVDTAARKVIADLGYADAFTHGLGHGVGLQIHEDPFLSARSPDRLTRRTPVTVEPGVYLRDRGGVRIEDTVVVREAGAPENLTAELTTDLVAIG
jgi:Xaa-Pro aminopeptidase